MADSVKPNKTVEIMVLTLFALINFLTIVVVCTCCYMWANKIEVGTGLAALLAGSITWTYTTVPGMIKEWMAKYSI